MNRAMLFLVVCLVAVEARAGLFTAVVLIPAPRETHTFRVEFNENAWIEHVWGTHAGNQRILPGSGANVDAFIAELTDGETDTLTFSTPYFSHSIAENAFFNREVLPSPFSGGGPWTDFPTFPDMLYFNISEIRMSAGNTSYAMFVEATGGAPEPSSGLLFLIGLCGVGLHRKHLVAAKGEF